MEINIYKILYSWLFTWIFTSRGNEIIKDYRPHSAVTFSRKDVQSMNQQGRLYLNIYRNTGIQCFFNFFFYCLTGSVNSQIDWKNTHFIWWTVTELLTMVRVHTQKLLGWITLKYIIYIFTVNLCDYGL